MNLFLVVFVAISVNLCVCGSIKTTMKRAAPTCPSCAVTSQIYKETLPGIILSLYYLTTNNQTGVDCLYYTYSDLNSNGATANYTVTYRTNGTYITTSSLVILTINGMAFQNDLDNNKPNVVSPTINSDGVITVNLCSESAYYIACNLNNCGSDVKEKAKEVAKRLANSLNYYSQPVDNKHCTNVPSSS